MLTTIRVNETNIIIFDTLYMLLQGTKFGSRTLFKKEKKIKFIPSIVTFYLCQGVNTVRG